MEQRSDNVKFVEIETYVHATEDIDKIVQALRENILGNIKIPIILEVLWGTFGNRIIRVKIFIENEQSEKILKKVLCNIHNIDKLKKTIRDRTDKAGNIYIRLNKQELIKGRLVLDDESDDIVRIKARISRRLLKDNLENLVDLLCREQ
ncbi:MAG: exosome protein [Crenarchaeota archaeon]|nr:exosome protein [Thermoproteota archaeon]